MRIIYLPISQYTLHELQQDGEYKYSNSVWEMFAHLDRFPNETIESLNDLFSIDVVLEFLRLLEAVDMLHWVRCKTIEGKEGFFLVISEYLHGDTYTTQEINGIEFPLKSSTLYPTGIFEQLDYYKLRDVSYDYEAIKPNQGIIAALRATVDRLSSRVMELLEQMKEKIYLEHELKKLQIEKKTHAQIESIYGKVNVEDLAIKMNLIVASILSASENEESKRVADMLVEQEQQSNDDTEDELQRLIDAANKIDNEEDGEDDSGHHRPVGFNDDDEPTYTETDEDEDEEDAENLGQEEEEDRLVDILDNMDRNELKAYIISNTLPIRVKKSMTDDDIRDAILDAKEDEEDYEDMEQVVIEDEEDDDLTSLVEGADDDEDILSSLKKEDEDKEVAASKVARFPNGNMADAIGQALERSGNQAIVTTSTPISSGMEYREQVVDFIDLMKSTNPGTIYPANTKAVVKACNTIHDIATIDKVDIDELFEALTWAIQDSFWKSQIISLAALRKTSQSNGLMKYQNVINSYMNALDKSTTPNADSEKDDGFING